MKSIITTYPDYQSLPKGVKRMLLLSEEFFFDEAKGLASERSVENKIPLSMSRAELFAGRMDSGVQFWTN